MKNTIWLLTVGAFFAFFVFGFSDNLKGPVLPALLQDLDLSYSLGGTILLGIYLGFMAATLVTGFLADAVGQKAVLVLAGVFLSLGVLGLNAFSSPFWLTASMSLLGFGMGSLELGCNALIVNVHELNKGRYLNLMAVMHGMGSMVAPLFAGWMLTTNNSWRAVYRWDLVLVGLMTVNFLLTRFPKKEGLRSEKIDFTNIGKKAFAPKMLVYYFAIALYVAFEIGAASWMAEYLQQARGQSVSQSAQALSLYFGLMMLGRFVGSFFIERFGYLRSILLSSLAASACVAAGLFGAEQLSILLPVSGLFLSIIFPTITAAVSNEHKQNMSSILGLLFTFAGFGGVMGPWLVGIASDIGGIRFGFSMNLVYGLLTAAAIFGLIQFRTRSA